MNAGCDDYEFWDYATTFAAVYIGLGVTSLVLNFSTLVLILKSKRLLGSPKYWPVLVVSAAFIFQSAVPSGILSAKWLSGEKTRDDIWITCFIFNKYIGLGISSWGSFIINLDYIICMKSASYTRYYRRKTMAFLMIIIWPWLIAGVIAAYYLKGEGPTEKSLIFGMGDNRTLLWATCFTPLSLSILCCAVIMLWRCSKLHKLIAANEDVSCPVDVGDCKYLLPSDHVAYLLILVIFYLPGTILTYEPIWEDQCPSVLSFRTVATVLRDNPGCIAPLAWFLYKDIRISCKHCFTKGDNMSPSSVQDSPEMNMYDSYPYCTRIQI